MVRHVWLLLNDTGEVPAIDMILGDLWNFTRTSTMRSCDRRNHHCFYPLYSGHPFGHPLVHSVLQLKTAFRLPCSAITPSRPTWKQIQESLCLLVWCWNMPYLLANSWHSQHASKVLLKYTVSMQPQIHWALPCLFVFDRKIVTLQDSLRCRCRWDCALDAQVHHIVIQPSTDSKIGGSNLLDNAVSIVSQLECVGRTNDTDLVDTRLMRLAVSIYCFEGIEWFERWIPQEMVWEAERGWGLHLPSRVRRD